MGRMLDIGMIEGGGGEGMGGEEKGGEGRREKGEIEGREKGEREGKGRMLDVGTIEALLEQNGRGYIPSLKFLTFITNHQISFQKTQTCVLMCFWLHKRSGTAGFTKRVVDYVETQPFPLSPPKKGPIRFDCEAVLLINLVLVIPLCCFFHISFY